MRIFVSHSSEDEELADVLVTLLQTALNLSSEDIRCTSLPGFGLTTGSNILDSLREDVRNAIVAIGLLTPSSLNSIWVIFELGARWGLRQNIVPLCAKGLTPHDLPEPLNSLAAADCCDKQQLQKLLEDVAEILELNLARASTYARFIDQIAEIASVSKQITNHSESTQEGGYESTVTQGETNSASVSRSPKLGIEWADVDSGEDLSTQSTLTSLLLEKPPEFPQLEPPTSERGGFVNPLENKNYFQEVLDYTAHKSYNRPLSIRLKNESEDAERRVRFVGWIKKSESLSVREELDPLPERYHSIANPLFQSERSNEDDARVSLRPYEYRWEVTIDFGNIRPHDNRTSCPLWFGSARPQTVRLEGELRGDDLKNPIECVLEAKIETEHRPMEYEDVLPFLELE